MKHGSHRTSHTIGGVRRFVKPEPLERSLALQGRIYIAGPMTGIPDHNFPAFDAAAAELRALGLDVVSPPDITRANPHPGIDQASGVIDTPALHALMRIDLRELLTCAAIALLPGWETSRGAQLELRVACAIGMPVYRVSELLDHSNELQPLQLAPTLGPLVRLAA